MFRLADFSAGRKEGQDSLKSDLSIFDTVLNRVDPMALVKQHLKRENFDVIIAP